MPKATIVVTAGKSHCSGLMSSTISSNKAGVFTIPANIPPPPQYCTSPCSELTPAQHSLHHSSPAHSMPYQHHTPLQQQISESPKMQTFYKNSGHSHFHVNPHHQHPTPNHPTHQQQQLQPHCHQQHHSHLKTSLSQQQVPPSELSSHCSHANVQNNPQNRCCSPPCKSSLFPQGDQHHGGGLIRSVSIGSPQCPHNRSLSPTQHHLMMHNQGRVASSTPPPRLQRQVSGASTPPQNGSTIHSPIIASPLASSPQQPFPTCSTLPRQRSQDVHSPPHQINRQGHSTTLRRQRSISDQPHQLQQGHSLVPTCSQMRSGSPQQKSFQHHAQDMKSPRNVSPPSELNYIQPNPELPTSYNHSCSSSDHISGNMSCVPVAIGKVQWNGAPSGTGSDV